MKHIEQIISTLELQPHPEGGFYKETYRHSQITTSSETKNERNLGTAIYFLLTSENFSAFHRIKQDEIWHFYSGSTLHLHILNKNGNYNLVKIGNDLQNGEVPQYCVNSGDWFAAEIPSNDSYALVGCTVIPGFDFRDFELASFNQLTKLYPKNSALIKKLTRS
ncbi:MAG: hypothetical protein BM564_00320 [Bacteroidetes bacterium MedPE-SWsnd-G2]|nr:MAG: hypothetical protein BM564_00320 [Bacteroidetes bacterium MedPE-SWsnd-G2]